MAAVSVLASVSVLVLVVAVVVMGRMGCLVGLVSGGALVVSVQLRLQLLALALAAAVFLFVAIMLMMMVLLCPCSCRRRSSNNTFRHHLQRCKALTKGMELSGELHKFAKLQVLLLITQYCCRRYENGVGNGIATPGAAGAARAQRVISSSSSNRGCDSGGGRKRH